MEQIPAPETPLVLEEQKVLVESSRLWEEKLWSLEGGEGIVTLGRVRLERQVLGDRRSPSL